VREQAQDRAPGDRGAERPLHPRGHRRRIEPDAGRRVEQVRCGRSVRAHRQGMEHLDHPALKPARSRVSLQLLNAAFGAWLFASTFIWPRVGPTGFNVWLVGLLVMATALTAIYVPAARYWNMILAGWLLFTAVDQVHESTSLALHDALLALAIFVVALFPGRLPEAPERAAA
jgi:hypothetical protein